MDPLTIALLALKAGAGFVEKTGQPREFAQVAPPPAPAADQPAAGKPGNYQAMLQQMMDRLFGAKNINPPVMQNMVGPFKPSSMPKDDPYGYGNYY